MDKDKKKGDMDKKKKKKKKDGVSDVSRRHHWIVRVTHWVNVVALTIMVGSGLRIFNAYPAFARKR